MLLSDFANQVVFTGDSPASVLKRISSDLQRGDLSQEQIRDIPGPILAIAIGEHGIAECVDSLELASRDQIQSIVDFKCWIASDLEEESLWEILNATDSTESLDFLKKIICSIDLKLIAYLINKHIETITLSEKSEVPPEVGFVTSDSGLTWFRTKPDENHRHFEMMCLMALLQEIDPRLFYQLINISYNTTSFELLEQCYLDSRRRLSEHNFPSSDQSDLLHSPIYLNQIQKICRENLTAKHFIDHTAIDIDTTSKDLEPVENTFRLNQESYSEFLQIAFAAADFFKYKIADVNSLNLLLEWTYSTICIGKDLILKMDLDEKKQLLLTQETTLISILGLATCYRVGVHELLKLRKTAAKFTQLKLQELQADSDFLQQYVPLLMGLPMPPCETINERRPFTDLVELESVRQILT